MGATMKPLILLSILLLAGCAKPKDADSFVIRYLDKDGKVLAVSTPGPDIARVDREADASDRNQLGRASSMGTPYYWCNPKWGRKP